ncbi:MAG: hypothetical protein Kow00121_24430 [Elainellaceae cyanobacterium]
MNARWQIYKRLELIPDSISPYPDQAAVSPQAKGFFQALEIALFRDLEPRFWRSVDQSGRVCWHLYSPVTGKTLHLNTDAKIRRWLERVFHG